MREHDLIRQAQDFAKSDAVSAILTRLEQKYIEKWKLTPEIGVETRESCWHMILAINELRKEIESLAQTERITEWNRRLHGKLT